jgi:hypothetical protein
VEWNDMQQNATTAFGQMRPTSYAIGLPQSRHSF